MPWTVRTILIISLIGVPLELYVALKTINALASVTSWPRTLIRLSALSVVLWFILYPLALVVSYYMEIGSISRALQSADMLTDKLLIYPFWTGIIFSAQVAQPLILMDAARLNHKTMPSLTITNAKVRLSANSATERPHAYEPGIKRCHQSAHPVELWRSRGAGSTDAIHL
jgi:hypothetical protein